jgi:hypothetical protein
VAVRVGNATTVEEESTLGLPEVGSEPDLFVAQALMIKAIKTNQ